MTNYKVVNKDENLIVEVKGHSGYAKEGKDIVCAAISTATIMTANLIDKLGLGYNILSLTCEDGYFRLEVKATDNTIKGIINNLEEMLDSLMEEYPKYIKKN